MHGLVKVLLNHVLLFAFLIELLSQAKYLIVSLQKFNLIISRILICTFCDKSLVPALHYDFL